MNHNEITDGVHQCILETQVHLRPIPLNQRANREYRIRIVLDAPRTAVWHARAIGVRCIHQSSGEIDHRRAGIGIRASFNGKP